MKKVHALPGYDVKSVFMIAICVKMPSFTNTRWSQVIKVQKCVDFIKAFDSVKHRFLFAKMSSFGVYVVVRWIEAYFTGQVPRVHVGRELSGTIPMHRGVPQGSVLGPHFTNLCGWCQNSSSAQNISLHRSLFAAWDESKKWVLPTNPSQCNYLTIGGEVPLRVYFSPMGLALPSQCSNKSNIQEFSPSAQ